MSNEDDRHTFPWGSQFRKRGERDRVAGVQPASHTTPYGESSYNSINYPILGVIDILYFSDDPRNKSNAIANPKSTNVAFHELLAKDTEEWFTRTLATTLHTGNRLEARIKIVMGPDGHKDSGTFIENVPVCIGFGGSQNYGYVVPSPTSNTGRSGYRGTENGDYCLVQFIGGSWSNPVITSTWPSPLNTLDPPMVNENVFAYARMAGTEIIINDEGDFVLDARNANEKTIVDPDDGVITKKPADGTEGVITLATRSDIYIAAGFPKDNEGSFSLPAGTAVIQASKDVEIFSTVNSVKVYSPNELYDANGDIVKDDKGNITNRVDIQGPRGSLRRAARQYDRIKITEGDDGDLFEFLSALKVTIEGMGQSLKGSLDPGAQAAGVLCETFANTYLSPTYQTGKVTTGSDYCYIAGKGDASDVGFDESGIKDALGDTPTSKDLEEIKELCIKEAIASYAAQVDIDSLKGKAYGSLTSGLKTAEKALEKIPGGQTPAAIIKEATPILMALLYTGSEIADIAPGLDSLVADVEAANDATETLEAIRLGEKTSWDLYDLNQVPPINPEREAAGLPNQAPHPTTGVLVNDAGWWYEKEDLDAPGSAYYFGTDVTPNAYTEENNAMETAGTEMGNILDPLLAYNIKDFNKNLSQVTAVGNAGTKAAGGDPTGALEDLDELTGGSITESVNECVNEELQKP